MEEYLKPFQSSLPWLGARTLFLSKSGSHAYGTATPQSDLDLRGVAVPPAEYFHGYHKRFTQAESKQDPDITVYDIRKFFKLAADCNPNIIEFLWFDEGDWIHSTRLWKRILKKRDLFLSKKVRWAYAGYAFSQLQRIKTHRRWLLNPPGDKPTRGEYGLPERTVIPRDQLGAIQARVQSVLDSWELDLSDLDPARRVYLLDQIAKYLEDVTGAQEIAHVKDELAGHLIGLEDNMLEVLGREKKYRQALKEWRSYQIWKENRNPIRAKMEAESGYDRKHAMHLVRLMRQAKEILSGEGVLVKRPDAEELLAIRNGAWSYDKLIEFAKESEDELADLYEVSTLPRSPDVEKLDNLCQSIVDEAIFEGII